jgi:glycosyltransferase involved in cell wall biosynthesis
MKLNGPFSIIIPVFNEVQIIGQTVRSIIEYLSDRSVAYELIVVDDGSSDGSHREIEGVVGVKVIRHPINLGNGASVKSGVRVAQYENCVIMDGDGQHQIGDTMSLLALLDDYALVVGARDFSSSGTWHRNLANMIYSRLASYVAETQILDLTSGLRAFHRSKVLEVMHLFPNRFSSPTTMTLSLLRLGYPVTFVPIEVKERRGLSKIRIFKDGFRFLMIILKISTLFSPMKIFMPVAFAMFFLGGINYLLFLFVEHRFSLWSVVLLTNAITIFMMGLVAEEISQFKLKRPD